MSTPELRGQCAERLLSATESVRNLTAFVGLDGFVDEIIHVVNKRDGVESFDRIPTIRAFAERIAGAVGRSTNIELVPQRIKLGGNGPIMANALASLGFDVTYLGALGYPELHPVFHDFAKRVKVYSIADPGYTEALEFEDGKVMLGKMNKLRELTWDNIRERFGRGRFFDLSARASLVAFVNWTMIPYMSDIWEALQKELCPAMEGPRRTLFFDLADPEKRNRGDIERALELIVRFQRHFDVILGLNEKESLEVATVLGLRRREGGKEGLSELAGELHGRLPVSTVVIHPVTYAVAAGGGPPAVVDGPFIPRPVITTGAGDHFNAGFCLGRLLEMDNAPSVLTGVAASGYYVRTGRSPSISQLAEMMQDWPQ